MKNNLYKATMTHIITLAGMHGVSKETMLNVILMGECRDELAELVCK